jgi:hypothetical protein
MSQLSKNAEMILSESHARGDELRIDLWYPRSEDNIRKFIVGLMDLRAADEIRISYDFDRDGWIIEQASTFAWDANDTVCDPDWKEVAFVKAWAREKPSPFD